MVLGKVLLEDLREDLSNRLRSRGFRGGWLRWFCPVEGLAGGWWIVNVYIDCSLDTAWIRTDFEFCWDISAVVGLIDDQPFVQQAIHRAAECPDVDALATLRTRSAFDLSDEIPTTLGVNARERVSEAVDSMLVGPLEEFQREAHELACTANGIVEMGLDRADGYLPVPRISNAAILFLAAAQATQGIGMAKLLAEAVDDLVQQTYPRAPRRAAEFAGKLDGRSLSALGAWEISGPRIEVISSPSPVPANQEVPARARWRQYGTPARQPSRVKTVNIRPGEWDDAGAWVQSLPVVESTFFTYDCPWSVNWRSPTRHDARLLERLLSDSFVDWAQFTQPENWYLQQMWARVVGLIAMAYDDGAWWETAEDPGRFPELVLSDGGIVSPEAVIYQALSAKSGKVFESSLVRS